MNRIVIVGNGFDLAHGLKTGYEDFLIDYFKEAMKLSREDAGKIYSDKLISVKCNTISKGIENQFSNLKELRENPNISFNRALKSYNVNVKSSFFELLIEKDFERWTDIENAYFDYLTKLLLKNSYPHDSINSFHDQFDELKSKLFSYLKKINDELSDELDSKDKLISDCFLTITDADFDNYFNKIKGFSYKIEKAFFLNFNYTSLLGRYLRNGDYTGRYDLKYIHGNIHDEKSIVFGYGDDTHPLYKELELLNNNEVLSKMKSFYYPANSDYIDIINFINDKEYDVLIIGHSLGVSDRVLLKTLFEHNNCIKISLFHRGENSHFRKRIALSRHFDDKQEMRNKIKPYDEVDRI